MKTTTVDKAQLLNTLITNRDKHAADFVEASAAWQQKAIDRLAEVRDQAVNGNFKNVSTPLSRLPKPENFLQSYDTAIERLKWEVEEQVELDEHEFANYVLDNWQWRDRFVANTSAYLVS